MGWEFIVRWRGGGPGGGGRTRRRALELLAPNGGDLLEGEGLGDGKKAGGAERGVGEDVGGMGMGQGGGLEERGARVGAGRAMALGEGHGVVAGLDLGQAGMKETPEGGP